VVISISADDRQRHLSPTIYPGRPTVGVVSRNFTTEGPDHRVGAVPGDNVTGDAHHPGHIRVHAVVPAKPESVHQSLLGNVGHAGINDGLQEYNVDLPESRFID
jgi:hypothetical protein